MASAPSATTPLSEDSLRCAICLDVMAEPVATPCGHNFCKPCVTRYWDNSSAKGAAYCCPLCRKVFHERPEVCVNVLLSEMADHFRKSKSSSNFDREPAAACRPDKVFCDVCAADAVKLKAVKSCLACLASYCDAHLEPHRRVPPLKRHALIECDGMKAELGRTEAELQRMIQERFAKFQQVKCSIDIGKKDTDSFVQGFTSLITTCIAQQKATEKHAEGLVRGLKQEITQLMKIYSELRQLSLTEDHLHLLQNFTSINTIPPTKDWIRFNVHQSSFVETVRSAVSQLEKTLSQEMEKLRHVELKRIQQYAVDVTLDPDTAHPSLILSDNGKQMYDGNKDNKLPDNKERFSKVICILGKQSFSSGRFYFEVQVKRKTGWDLGVVRESINRKGGITATPNNGYWTLGLRNGNEYEAHAGPPVLLPVRETVQTVGVFVDYEEGLVSFYDVEARVHLYSFTGCTFTGKLYPFFGSGRNVGGRNSASLIISPVSHTVVARYDCQQLLKRITGR